LAKNWQDSNLLRGFATNRVRKRGKSRCLLASIRLAEVLFATQKASLILFSFGRFEPASWLGFDFHIFT
jgi:hypothetical protein